MREVPHLPNNLHLLPLLLRRTGIDEEEGEKEAEGEEDDEHEEGRREIKGLL